ncbi:hypothetical protein B0H14DRAFT_2588587 [Mycena olivaceomarginata]|nr:hypothetical protein B0H14DRAFT_2588587 [Mycena olivaceomarginata]
MLLNPRFLFLWIAMSLFLAHRILSGGISRRCIGNGWKYRWGASSCYARSIVPDMPGIMWVARMRGGFEFVRDPGHTFKCRWDGCGEEFSNRRRLIEHIDSYVLETIHCGYQDCEETLRTPRELVEHNLRHREQRTALKPSTRPSAPHQLLPPPELGQNFPTWALPGPAVQIPGIPKDRRKTLSAWVIF